MNSLAMNLSRSDFSGGRGGGCGRSSVPLHYSYKFRRLGLYGMVAKGPPSLELNKESFTVERLTFYAITKGILCLKHI